MLFSDGGQNAGVDPEVAIEAARIRRGHHVLDLHRLVPIVSRRDGAAVRTAEGRQRVHAGVAALHHLGVDRRIAGERTARRLNGRKLGTVEEGFANTLAPGDHFFFSGLSLEVERIKDGEIYVHASSKSARIVTYGGQRMSMSTHLANRVRHMLCDRNDWHRFPDDVREWLEVQQRRSRLPQPDELLVETFPLEGRHYMVMYSFEGWNAHQSLGMLITKRMENAGLKPLGFVANDYAIAVYGLEPIRGPCSRQISSSASSSTGSSRAICSRPRSARWR